MRILHDVLVGRPSRRRRLPQPDPQVSELHERQHRIINDLQRLEIVQQRQDIKRRRGDE